MREKGRTDKTGRQNDGTPAPGAILSSPTRDSQLTTHNARLLLIVFLFCPRAPPAPPPFTCTFVPLPIFLTVAHRRPMTVSRWPLAIGRFVFLFRSRTSRRSLIGANKCRKEKGKTTQKARGKHEGHAACSSFGIFFPFYSHDLTRHEDTIHNYMSDALLTVLSLHSVFTTSLFILFCWVSSTFIFDTSHCYFVMLTFCVA